MTRDRGTRRRDPAGRIRRRSAIVGIVLGALAFWLALPPLAVAHRRAADRARDPRDRGRASGRGRATSAASAAARSPPGLLGIVARRARDALVVGAPRPGRRLERARRGDAPLRDAADVRGDRRPLLRAQRRDQRRARGDAADRRVLRHLGRDLGALAGRAAAAWVVGRRLRGARRAWRSRRSTRSGRST